MFKIIAYEALCNLGSDINSIYKKAIVGDTSCFINIEGYFDNYIRAGLIKAQIPEISDEKFNIRCNRLLLKNIELLKKEIYSLKERYPKERIGIITATTNTGVEEYSHSKNMAHSELSNPAEFLRNYLDIQGFYSTVSTACSSGIKVFSTARDLLKNNILDSVIVACVDSIASVPVYGFNSLEILSNKPSIPFSKNRCGMNLGEASSIFIIEKDVDFGIEIMGIGETSDIYHSTTPDPEGIEAINAIRIALNDAKINENQIDYINAHGTGTIANDIMEATAINKIFYKHNLPPVSSTKPMTGHCLGASAGIELALCCKLLDNFDGRLYPHCFDGEYDNNLERIELVKKDKQYKKCNICMCSSFGFGGTNAIIIIGKHRTK